MQVNVDQLMRGELGQWLSDQSAMRHDAMQKAKARWLGGGAIAAGMITFMWLATERDGMFGAFVSAALIIGVAVFGYLPIAEATKAIKVGINSAIAHSLGVSYEHDVIPGEELPVALKYGLLPGHDRRTLEDCWSGRMEGHRFRLYEVWMERREGTGKNQRWVTVFRGALIEMEFGRPFHSTTLLQRAGKHRKWLGFGAAKDDVTFSGHRLALVDQVHPAFEDVFQLYSDDQVEARVLVHPSYVEHLVAVERAFDGDAMRALFQGGSVIVAVESGDLFESGALDGARDRERVEEAAQQFTALARLALAINQNERGRALGQTGPYDARDLGKPVGLSKGFGRRGV